MPGTGLLMRFGSRPSGVQIPEPPQITGPLPGHPGEGPTRCADWPAAVIEHSTEVQQQTCTACFRTAVIRASTRCGRLLISPGQSGARLVSFGQPQVVICGKSGVEGADFRSRRGSEATSAASWVAVGRGLLSAGRSGSPPGAGALFGWRWHGTTTACTTSMTRSTRCGCCIRRHAGPDRIVRPGVSLRGVRPHEPRGRDSRRGQDSELVVRLVGAEHVRVVGPRLDQRIDVQALAGLQVELLLLVRGDVVEDSATHDLVKLLRIRNMVDRAQSLILPGRLDHEIAIPEHPARK